MQAIASYMVSFGWSQGRSPGEAFQQFLAGGIEPGILQGPEFTGIERGILVLAQPEGWLRACHDSETEALGSSAQPFTYRLIGFGEIVPDG